MSGPTRVLGVSGTVSGEVLHVSFVDMVNKRLLRCRMAFEKMGLLGLATIDRVLNNNQYLYKHDRTLRIIAPIRFVDTRAYSV